MRQDQFPTHHAAAPLAPTMPMQPPEAFPPQPQFNATRPSPQPTFTWSQAQRPHTVSGAARLHKASDRLYYTDNRHVGVASLAMSMNHSPIKGWSEPTTSPTTAAQRRIRPYNHASHLGPGSFGITQPPHARPSSAQFSRTQRFEDTRLPPGADAVYNTLDMPSTKTTAAHTQLAPLRSTVPKFTSLPG